MGILQVATHLHPRHLHYPGEPMACSQDLPRKGVGCTLSAHEVAFDQGLGEWLAALEHMQQTLVQHVSLHIGVL